MFHRHFSPACVICVLLLIHAAFAADDLSALPSRRSVLSCNAPNPSFLKNSYKCTIDVKNRQDDTVQGQSSDFEVVTSKGKVLWTNEGPAEQLSFTYTAPGNEILSTKELKDNLVVMLKFHGKKGHVEGSPKWFFLTGEVSAKTQLACSLNDGDKVSVGSEVTCQITIKDSNGETTPGFGNSFFIFLRDATNCNVLQQIVAQKKDTKYNIFTFSVTLPSQPSKVQIVTELRSNKGDIAGSPLTLNVIGAVTLPALNSQNTVVNGLTYIATASSTYGGSEAPWMAFDKNSGSFWTDQSNDNYNSQGLPTAARATVANGATYNGEWLQIQLPFSSLLSNYTLSTRSGAPSRGPSDFYVFGSNDGNTWSLVDRQSGIQWPTADPQPFISANSKTPFMFFRLVVTKKVPSSDTWLSIGEWNFNSLPTPGQALTIPALTGQSSNINGLTYIATASSAYGGGEAPWMAFDNNYGSFWTDQGNSYNGQGQPTTTYTTTSNGVTYVGDWLQIQLPVSLVLQNYTISSRSAAPSRGPSDFYVFGSNDGNTWIHVDHQSGVQWPTADPQPFISANGNSAFTYFRLVVTKKLLNSDTCLSISEWAFNSLPAAGTPMVLLALTGQSSNIKGLTYIVTASSMYGGGEAPWMAFDKNYGSFWTDQANSYNTLGNPTTSYSTTSNGFTYSGDWLQIQLPVSSVLQNYTLSSRSAAPSRGPSDFYVFGSNDGNTWTPVDRQSGIQWPTADPQPFISANGNAAFTYFRLVVTKKLLNSDNWLSISEWAFNVLPPAGTAVVLPALSSPSTVFNSATYIATSSSVYGGSEAAWMAFDKNPNTFWTDSSNVNYNQGLPTTNYITKTSDGIDLKGDWLQIQLPAASLLTNYTVSSRYDSPSRGPQEFYILASNDASTWFVVDHVTGVQWSTADPQTFVSTNSESPYLFYRMVVTKKIPSGDSWLSVGEWSFNTAPFAPGTCKKLGVGKKAPHHKKNKKRSVINH